MEGETVSTATATVHGRHRQASRWAGWSRGRRAAVVAVVLLVVAAVVAVALVLFRAPIGGSVDSASSGLEWTSNGGANFPTVVENGAACTVEVSSETLLTVSMTLAYPDSSCEYTAGLRTPAGSDEGAVVTGLTLTGLPTGWAAELDPGSCGTVVGDTYDPVTFTITMTETAAIGSGGTISATTSGVEAVPESQYEAAMCP
jgi:hypothetical protein